MTSPAAARPVSLFEAFPEAYAFFREHLFRDHTEAIVAALWPSGAPPRGAVALEVGCGPGYYARRLAARFPGLRALGVDRAEAQLALARRRAAAGGLGNCRFERGDARGLSWADGTVDAVLACRLFTVLAERERALAEMHRVLRPGGRCFVAEPRRRVRAAVPLLILWLLAGAAGGARRRAYREPLLPAALPPRRFAALIGSQRWGRVRLWQDAHYCYAACQKA